MPCFSVLGNILQNIYFFLFTYFLYLFPRFLFIFFHCFPCIMPMDHDFVCLIIFGGSLCKFLLIPFIFSDFNFLLFYNLFCCFCDYCFACCPVISGHKCWVMYAKYNIKISFMGVEKSVITFASLK
jgi:hypothetical protein